MLYQMRQRKVTHTKLRWMFNVIAMLGFLMILQGQISSKADSTVGKELRLIPDHLYDVDFVDAKNGLATGYYGTILQTHDGGKTWARVNANIQELIRRVDMVSIKKAWAVGHRGSIFHTEDGGLTWQVQTQVKGIYLRDISFASETTGWAVGHEMTILHTSDGGQTWQKQKLSGYKGRDLPRLNGVKAINETTAILIGEFGVVGYTSDGGKTWQLVPSGVRTSLTAVDQNGADAVIVGLDGMALYLSLEDEPKISRIDTGTKQHIFDINVNGNGEGVAVGRTVLLKFSKDKVMNVKAEDSVNLPYSWYYGVHILDNGEVVAVGLRGAIIKAASIEGPFRLVAKIGDPETVSFVGNVIEEVK